jgi:hypothetical protein
MLEFVMLPWILIAGREISCSTYWIGTLIKNPANEVVEAFFKFEGSTAAVQELFPVLGGLA